MVSSVLPWMIDSTILRINDKKIPMPRKEYKMKPLFTDPALQSRFEEDGFVVLPCRIPSADVERLSALFDSIAPNRVRGVYSNLFGKNKNVNLAVDLAIRDAIQPYVDQYFSECRMTGGMFLAKGLGDGSESNLHQDWCMVDETRHDSVNVWCPLTDVDEENGALQVLKGTHRLSRTIRAMTMRSLFIEFRPDIAPYLTPVPMQAGQLVVYSHRVFHGSKPNRSERIRVAMAAGVVPRDAHEVHYYRDPLHPDAAIEMFAFEQARFYEESFDFEDQGRPAHLTHLAVVEHQVHPLDLAQVIAKMRDSLRGCGRGPGGVV